MTDDPRDKRLSARDVEAEHLPDWRMLFDRLHARLRHGGLRDRGPPRRRRSRRPRRRRRTTPTSTFLRPSRRPPAQPRRGWRDGTRRRPRADRRSLAREAGATARPDRLSVLELALDAIDEARIRPFWAALLDADVVEASNELQVQDATGRIPTVWFQLTDAHATPRQRWHLDLRVPPEVVQDRMAAAVAAGGTLVDDSHAPAFWVLADRRENRACLTTWEAAGV